MSQNRPPADRVGVVRGLEAAGDPVALETAGLVRRYGGLGCHGGVSGMREFD